MLANRGDRAMMLPLDGETAALVRIAAAVAAHAEPEIRDELRRSSAQTRAEWVEEVILQSYLFAGFPRALNAMRLWRSISGRDAPTERVEEYSPSEWMRRGEQTCALVYGPFYARLRVNIAALHPALDAWMIEEGYGKVLSRPELDLVRRELCVIGACVAARQDRQLHSHLHGALHVGASHRQVEEALEVALDTAGPLIAADDARRYRQLWHKVAGRDHQA